MDYNYSNINPIKSSPFNQKKNLRRFKSLKDLTILHFFISKMKMDVYQIRGSVKIREEDSEGEEIDLIIGWPHCA